MLISQVQKKIHSFKFILIIAFLYPRLSFSSLIESPVPSCVYKYLESGSWDFIRNLERGLSLRDSRDITRDHRDTKPNTEEFEAIKAMLGINEEGQGLYSHLRSSSRVYLSYKCTTTNYKDITQEYVIDAGLRGLSTVRTFTPGEGTWGDAVGLHVAYTPLKEDQNPQEIVDTQRSNFYSWSRTNYSDSMRLAPLAENSGTFERFSLHVASEVARFLQEQLNKSWTYYFFPAARIKNVECQAYFNETNII